MIISAAVLTAVGVSLVADNDAHGVAILAGLVAGSVLGARRPKLNPSVAH